MHLDPNNSQPAPDRVMIVTTMFDHGGVVSYWRDVISLIRHTRWSVFTNRVDGVDVDPFKNPDVEVTVGLVWSSALQSSRNLIHAIEQFTPRVLMLNATLAVVRLLPALVYLRVFHPEIKLQCVFHNGAIYPSWYKNFINRITVSLCSLLMHRNIFVSNFVKRYWFNDGTVMSRPFAAEGRVMKPVQEPVIGFLGRLSHEKDPALFLESLSLVRKNLNCRVVVAGVGPLAEPLSHRYPWAEFVGWVRPQEWLAKVDLLVSTSKTEGWPYAIGESLEVGTPVLGVAVGGVPEILRPVLGDWVTDGRDANTIATMIERFFSQHAKNYEDYFDMFKRAEIRLASEWANDLLNVH